MLFAYRRGPAVAWAALRGVAALLGVSALLWVAIPSNFVSVCVV